MFQQSSNKQATPDLLPWQAVVMVVCVTAAGLVHQHPSALKPLAAPLEHVALRAGVSHLPRPAAVLNAVLWPRR